MSFTQKQNEIANFNSTGVVLYKKEADHPSNLKHFWSSKDRRKWMGALFLGCMTLYTCRSVMSVCSPSVSKEMNWNKQQMGTILSAFFWGYTMTQVLGGYLSDRYGGDVVMTTSAIGWSLITFWTPFITSTNIQNDLMFTIFVISRVLAGCFQGVHYPALTSLIGQKTASHQRTFTYATSASGNHFGTIFTGSIGSLLVSHFGWRSSFYLFGFLSMAWIIFTRFFIIEKERRRVQLLSLKDNELFPNSSNLNTHEAVPWCKLISKTPFWAMVFCHMCHAAAFFILLSWLPTYFQENFKGAQAWVFNMVPWLVVIPCAISSGIVADFLIKMDYSVTFTRKLIETISLTSSAVLLILLPLFNSYTGSLTCMSFVVAGFGMHNGAILINPQDLAPKFSGSVFGIMNMSGSIAGFTAVYFAGYILEATKSWTILFTQTSFLCLLGWVVYILFGSGEKIV